MCGITGIYNLDGEPVSKNLISRMTNVISHRGPDDEGYFFMNTYIGSYQILGGGDTPKECYSSKYHSSKCYRYFPEKSIRSIGNSNSDLNNSCNLSFGHRRLSIIDLSPAGHQPMCNEDETVWVTYNGEIYNYPELMSELRDMGHDFKSKTDTEVIIHAYEEYGEKCIEQFNGMFAFAIWDSTENKLFCARDRFGIKPFYYFFTGDRFLFASEIKAILEDNSIKRIPNDEIIYDYLISGALDQTDETFFKGIKQILPAHYMTIKDKKIQINRYWDLDSSDLKKADSGSSGKSGKSDKIYAKKFYELFEDSVRFRLRSDVPVGTCLSGGLDSSAIVCVADKIQTGGMENGTGDKGKLNTFSSCFDDKKYDEREFIEYVLTKTGAVGNYTFPPGEELFDILPDVIWHQDEPFGSTSIFAQWHVMKLARERDIPVLLDGQGADELLAGYHLYFRSFFMDLWANRSLMAFLYEGYHYFTKHKYPITSAISDVLGVIVPKKFRNFISYLLPRKAINCLNDDFVKEMEGIKQNKKTIIQKRKYDGNLPEHLYLHMTSTRLPELLRYEDRNSMAFSIESRVPFLDYRLVEFMFSLPNNQKIHRGTTKIILRNAMKGTLPETIRTRMDKMGFVTPEDIWFRTVAKDKILEIINSESFGRRKYFNVEAIKREFDMHCNGKKNISVQIWGWINMELWLRQFID